MYVIVPLAGPDFLRADGSIKALESLQGQPLLKYALDSRPWSLKVKKYIFVLHDCLKSRQFSEKYLRYWYSNSSFVYLSSFSRGAAMSSLAALSSLNNYFEPLIIDLADILYESNINVKHVLDGNPELAAIALSFKSENPQYSYLISDENNQVIQSAEKRVISDNASAGTYIFRDCGILLKAFAHAVSNESTQTFNDLFYVCPLFNGVIANKGNVLLERVSNVVDIKLA